MQTVRKMRKGEGAGDGAERVRGGGGAQTGEPSKRRSGMQNQTSHRHTASCADIKGFRPGEQQDHQGESGEGSERVQGKGGPENGRKPGYLSILLDHALFHGLLYSTPSCSQDGTSRCGCGHRYTLPASATSSRLHPPLLNPAGNSPLKQPNPRQQRPCHRKREGRQESAPGPKGSAIVLCACGQCSVGQRGLRGRIL
eukprot:2490514-Rhodomonas_salina.3